MTEKTWIRPRPLPDWVHPIWAQEDPLKNSKTRELSNEVVDIPFQLAIYSQVVEGVPRAGGMHIALSFGDQDNGVLTSDQVEYVVAMVRAALEVDHYEADAEPTHPA